MNSLVLTPWLALTLVLARILAFIVTAPILNRRGIPSLLKIGLGVFVALIVFAGEPMHYEGSTSAFIGSLISETMVGLCMGMLASWLFQSFTMGGQLIDQQAGFGSAAMFDPGSSIQVSLISNFILFISILLFLELDGHHILLLGIIKSFQVVPVGAGVLGLSLGTVVLRALTASMVLMIRVAIPVVVVLVLTDLILGMIGRAVPQLNVLMLGLPVKAGVALLVLAAVSPAFLGVGGSLLSELEGVLSRAFGVMAP
ncbi:MAG: flagellar biosynthetic protein FliR [Bacillota bacterium]|nr:MAG: flagellar biosynthetic protein FliR [Bacillota bacterium]MBS3951255.1 flagellar biosynthetic protein FliR [Peptococcaceae bacterium]